jgi:hypothetical protein
MTKRDSQRRRTSAIWLACVLLVVAMVAMVTAGTPVGAGQGESGNQRPLSDWISQQGNTAVFFPPVPDLLGWGNVDDQPLQPLRFALVDYTGQFNEWIKDNGGPDLGTTVSGTVTEHALADGRARVQSGSTRRRLSPRSGIAAIAETSSPGPSSSEIVPRL